MKKLLFLTTTNLSTNPRLLKELKLAQQNGYECTFIGFKLGNWSDKTELEHLKSLNNVKTYYLSAGTSTRLSDLQQLMAERSRRPVTERSRSQSPGISAPLNDQVSETEHSRSLVAERSRSQRSFRLRSMALWWWLSLVKARYQSTLVSKLSIFINKIFRKNLKLSAYAHNKRSWQLIQKLRPLKCDYDLLIAHNLGALYPAMQFSKKHKIPFAFDIEDYHPGEKCSPAEKHRREFLMKELLPNAAYISYASPLIGEHSLELITRVKPDNSRLEAFKYLATGTKCISRTVCDADMIDEIKTDDEKNLDGNAEKGHFDRLNDLSFNKSTLINNSFSQNEFEFKENDSDKIQLVWFSQNITWGRGLEQMLPALAKFKDKLLLNLIGNRRQDFHKEYLKRYDEFINYIDPLPQKELNYKIGDYDIGLAIEISAVDINKDIALSNKIFAYTQAGLYILATDTSAQKMFIEDTALGFGSAQPPIKGSLSGAEMPLAQPPASWLLSEAEMPTNQSSVSGSLSKVEMPPSKGIGLLSGQSIEEMEQTVAEIIDNIDSIRAHKKARFEYAKQLAWEYEGDKLLEKWNGIFS